MDPRIIAPSDSMHDEAICIKVYGLEPRSCITLHAFTSTENGNKFESMAHLIADKNGSVDNTKDKSFGGSFTGVEPMGLFWSMKPSLTNKNRYPRMVKYDVTSPLIVTVVLIDGWIKSEDDLYKLKKAGSLNELTSITVNRWMKLHSTERVVMDFKKDGIYGTLFVPAGKGPFPGVLVMFGNIPGTLEFQAALLASHGFAALALIYIGRPGLPKHGEFLHLKLEYFERATNVLFNHPKVDRRVGLGVMGKSYGASIVLAMGALLPNIKCVIWQNGFTYPLFGQISYRNRTFPRQKDTGFEKALITKGSNTVFYGRSVFQLYDDPFCTELDESRIPFHKRHDVGYMFIASLNDESNPSEHFLNQAEKMLRESRHLNYELLRYPGAGHLLDPCYGLHHPITADKTFGILMDWGGETLPHCKAQVDSWFRQIKFLKTNLRLHQTSNL